MIFLLTQREKLSTYGLYDINLNIGYITIGTSADTSEFACESIKNWWLNYGYIEYQGHDKLLLLCDGGGSNSSRHYIFKEDLQKLSEELQIEIRIAHYPPYTSKYNPIEHRLFPHITRALQGVIFTSVELVNTLIAQTKTTTGLKVFSSILDKVFHTKRKYAEGFKENMKIIFDIHLPLWNYVAIPKKY
ncbi:MAG: ISAzo13 family transposase [Sulfurovum sp.]|nr:ISAzo13 family transposase [Sulfurovum sp.]